MRKFIAVLGLAGLLLPGVAGAANIFEKVGTFDGQFLKIPVGARATGMGGAFTGVSDDATSIFWNVAGIARIEAGKNQITLDHAFWPADISYSFAAYVFHIKRFPGAFGISWRAVYMDPMNETTAYQPNGTGSTFDAGNMSFGFSYARSFTDKFSAGGTFNFIQMGLAEYSQESFAFDVGTLYDVGAAGMRIGMSISSIGSEVQFIERSGRLPSIFRVGTSFNLLQSSNQRLIGSFEFSHPPDNSERVNVGAEYTFQKFLFLRAGYNFNYDAEALAAGVGVHIPVSVAGQADVDYSFTDMRDLGAVHRVSLKFLF